MDRILSAPEPAIRATLVALCDDDRLRARCLAYLDQLDQLDQHLAAAAPGATAEPRPSSDPDVPSPSGGALGKRKAPAAPQICVQCRSAFSPGSNHPEACLHHDGGLAIDRSDEVWAGWDEHVSGPRGTDESRDEHPRGFRWSCCERDGTGPGCARGLHVAVRIEHKRPRRLSGLERDPDVARMFEGRVLRPNEFVNEDLWAGSWDGTVATRGAPSGVTSDDGDGDGDDDYDDDARVW